MVEIGEPRPTIVIDGEPYDGAEGPRLSPAEILAFVGKDNAGWDLYAEGENGQRLTDEEAIPVQDGARFETRPREQAF